MIEPLSFQTQILDWYDVHGRKSLPWQQHDPYIVWISEIMLQQTQVETVIPFFNRFIQRFPDLNTLSSAPIEAVIELWAGLGYYARARNLHRTAQVVVREHDGKFPKTNHELESLPGIGRSTAGAILSLGFGIRAPILDGNLKRVFSRQIGLETWPGSSTAQNKLWALIDHLTPEFRVGPFNQALMDIGALVCRRKNPKCMVCPINASCNALATQRIDTIPAPKPIRKKLTKKIFALVLCDTNQQIYLERRPPEGIWGGLNSFPEFSDLDSLFAFVQNRFKETVEPAVGAPLKHVFTHFELIMTPIHLTIPCHQAFEASPMGKWFSVEGKLGAPAPVEKILKLREVHFHKTPHRGGHQNDEIS